LGETHLIAFALKLDQGFWFQRWLGLRRVGASRRLYLKPPSYAGDKSP